MTPTVMMQKIEEHRQRLLKNQSSEQSRKIINETADELHEEETKRYKSLLKLIQAQNEGRNDF